MQCGIPLCLTAKECNSITVAFPFMRQIYFLKLSPSTAVIYILHVHQFTEKDLSRLMCR